MFPLVAPVKRRLIAHKLATGRDGDDLVTGRTATRPFVPSTVRRHALAAWEAAGATWCLTGFGSQPRPKDVTAAINTPIEP